MGESVLDADAVFLGGVGSSDNGLVWGEEDFSLPFEGEVVSGGSCFFLEEEILEFPFLSSLLLVLFAFEPIRGG